MTTETLSPLTQHASRLQIFSTSLRISRGNRLRTRILSKYEPTLPKFDNYFDEIEWRLFEINSEVEIIKDNDPVGWKTIARHWCQVAILAGYVLREQIVQRKQSKVPLYLNQCMIAIWQECFSKLILDYAQHLHPECNQKNLKEFYILDSYGRQYSKKVENVVDLISQVLGIHIEKDEARKCIAMLETMRKYYSTTYGLTIVKKNHSIVITRVCDGALFEVVAMQKNREQLAC